VDVMLYRLYPNDILKREEVKQKLTMEDLIIEGHLKSYDKFTEEQVNKQFEEEQERKRKK
jgi:hypothetical protein